MHPVLRDSDLVVVKQTAVQSLRIGNIIVYRKEKGGYVIHRFIGKVKENILCLKGDGYNLPAEEAPADSVIGRAIGFVRNNRYRPLNRPRELYSWLVSSVKGHAKRSMKCLCVVFK